MKTNRCTALGILIALLCGTARSASAQTTPVFEQTSGGWTIDVYQEEGPNDSHLRLAAAGPGNQHREAWLDWRTQQLTGVFIWNDAKLVLLGEDIGQDVNVVPIAVDAPSDFLRGFDLAVSPDHRFLAYREFRPREDESSDVFLTYDLGADPTANRMQTQSSDILAGQVGLAFYPSERRQTQTYFSSQGDTTPVHGLVSPLVWVDSHRLALVTYASDHLVRVVLADFANGASHPLVAEQILDTQSVVDASSIPAGATSASSIAVGSITGATTAGGIDLTLTIPQSPARAIAVTSVVVHF